ncbi:MAG: electron transfer flavoprotein subunit beta/FixA family protein [Clostridia bacterium]|nr:electron transfer flavoprotein subunit beta/FixA family protein [Clostridia bacterium]
MNIIVCVKQVPVSTEVRMNRDTNTIIREGVESTINPFDSYAVEEALRIKEKLGGKVSVLSMGIPSASGMLKDIIALGADEAILLSDRAFAGSDTLATSYVLSMAIRRIADYDIVICGKQASDGDTAQVGPSLAEKLGIPHTTYVKKIEEIRGGYIKCQRLFEEGFEIIGMTLPAVITVVKGINEPRMPSIRGVLRAKAVEVKRWTADDINVDKERCGLKGSPTQVVKTFIPNYEVQGEMIEGEPQEQVRRLADRLMSMQFMKVTNRG